MLKYLMDCALRLEINREFIRLKRLAFPGIHSGSSKKWRLENKAYDRSRWKAWYEKNKAYCVRRQKEWVDANRERYNLRRQELRRANPDRDRAYDRKRQPAKTIYNRKRRHAIIDIRIAGAHRNRIWAALRGKSKYRNSKELLGCSIEDYKIYLETKFEPGMSWENYGRNGWHVDHIMPCAIFDLTDPEHQKRCFHFSNMQPMWATQNHRKGAKVCG